ncbi:MAG: TlpA family protein disulfide reductase [Proteobacteria bacterium]|nr:TlpA family protein disulfide reductase [Pseudomonadota bacterium]
MRHLLPIVLFPLMACSGGVDETVEEEPAYYGPDNQWFHAFEEDMPADLAATGNALGQVPANFTFIDQNGDEVELYQFYGQVVQLILFAQWCGPCQDEAPLVEATSVDLADDGVVILGVMLEGNNGPATPENLDQWILEYSVTHPMLADPKSTMSPMLLGGFPTLPVLDRELKIANVDNFPFDPVYLETLAAQ